MATGETSGLPDDVWHDKTLTSKYRIEELLGTGGQAVVFAAHHLQLDERVALKFLLPEVAQSSVGVARFYREARAAAKIKNEHVVRIIDVCSTEAGLPYIVMEYLAGQTLEQRLQMSPGNRLQVSDAVDFILQAGEALAEGHHQGIVHRDLKPANLFCVDRSDGFPMIKVLDFGISKIKPLKDDVERTDRHEILGSPRYMSPEQIGASRDVDQRSDIWSLGVILYQCLTGQVPFDGEFVPELWQKVRNDTPPSPTELRASIPRSLSAIVMKCLEKARDKRFSDLSELASALAPHAPQRSRLSVARIVRIATNKPEYVDSTSPVMKSDRWRSQGPRQRTDAHWSRRKLLLVLGGLVALVALIQPISKRLTAVRVTTLPGTVPTAVDVGTSTPMQQAATSGATSAVSISNSSPSTATRKPAGGTLKSANRTAPRAGTSTSLSADFELPPVSSTPPPVPSSTEAPATPLQALPAPTATAVPAFITPPVQERTNPQARKDLADP